MGALLESSSLSLPFLHSLLTKGKFQEALGEPLGPPPGPLPWLPGSFRCTASAGEGRVRPCAWRTEDSQGVASFTGFCQLCGGSRLHANRNE